MLRRKKADPVFDALRGMPAFESLSDKDVRALASAGRETTHPAGAVIMKQGDMGVGFHVIMDGAVDIVAGDQKVATLATGDFFGEIGLIDEQPRTATVIAVSDLRVLVVMSWAFRPMLERYPGLQRVLLDRMTRRLRERS